MKIRVKPLNKDETYCCSVNAAKSIFRNTQVKLNFTSCGNEFKNRFEHPLYNFVKKTVKGKVIAYFVCASREESPLINLFSIKQIDYSEYLKKIFDDIFLPEFYNLYLRKLTDKTLLDSTDYVVVELREGNLRLHTKN